MEVNEEINKLKEEINNLNNQMSNLWLKHTFYNTTLFVLGMSVLTISIFSPDNINSIRETIHTFGKSIESVNWEIVNQCIYVIDGKILFLGTNTKST